MVNSVFDLKILYVNMWVFGSYLFCLFVVMVKVGVVKSMLYKLMVDGKFFQLYCVLVWFFVWDFGEVDVWISVL